MRCSVCLYWTCCHGNNVLWIQQAWSCRDPLQSCCIKLQVVNLQTQKSVTLNKNSSLQMRTQNRQMPTRQEKEALLEPCCVMCINCTCETKQWQWKTDSTQMSKFWNVTTMSWQSSSSEGNTTQLQSATKQRWLSWICCHRMPGMVRCKEEKNSSQPNLDVSVWWFGFWCQLKSLIHQSPSVILKHMKKCATMASYQSFFGIRVMHFVLSTSSSKMIELTFDDGHVHIVFVFSICPGNLQEREERIHWERKEMEKRKGRNKRQLEKGNWEEDKFRFCVTLKSHFGRTRFFKWNFWNWGLPKCFMLRARRQIFKTARFGRWECSLVSHSHVAS